MCKPTLQGKKENGRRELDFVSWCMLYIHTKVTKCIREKMMMYFRGLTIKSHSPGYEIGPINPSV